MHVSLVDSRNHITIYADKFMYGYHNPFMSGTDIDAPETHFFKNKGELFADATKLVDGMRMSVDAVVEEIAKNLTK